MSITFLKNSSRRTIFIDYCTQQYESNSNNLRNGLDKFFNLVLVDWNMNFKCINAKGKIEKKRNYQLKLSNKIFDNISKL